MNGNPYCVCDLLDLMDQTSGKLRSLTKVKRETEGNGLGLDETYDDLILDELGHLQRLTLELTKQLAGVTRSDESAFFEGELDHKKKGELEATGAEEKGAGNGQT